MGRVINTDSPGKRRNNLMRTSAELLRRLSTKSEIDADSKDMLAFLVYCLREIDSTIDESARAWEKRDYWMKSEEFRERWKWSKDLSEELGSIVTEADWQNVPPIMAKLFSNFSDIKINKLTRKPSLWDGCYDRFLSDNT